LPKGLTELIIFFNPPNHFLSIMYKYPYNQTMKATIILFSNVVKLLEVGSLFVGMGFKIELL